MEFGAFVDLAKKFDKGDTVIYRGAGYLLCRRVDESILLSSDDPQSDSFHIKGLTPDEVAQLESSTGVLVHNVTVTDNSAAGPERLTINGEPAEIWLPPYEQART